MKVWKKSLLGAAVSVAMIGGGAAHIGAQEVPTSITAHVEVCPPDTSSGCLPIQGYTVMFDINGAPETVNVQTDANGNAAIEVSVGASVTAVVNPDGVENSTLANDTPSEQTITVAGDDVISFVYVENATPAPAPVNPTPAPALPATGAGPLGDVDTNTSLMLATMGGAMALAGAGFALRKRTNN